MKAQRLVTITLQPGVDGSVESHLIDVLKNGWKIESVTAMPVTRANSRSEVVMAVVLKKYFDAPEYEEYKKFDADEFRT